MKKRNFEYETEMLENISVEDIQRMHNNTVNIYIYGSAKNGKGHSRYILQYGEAKKLGFIESETNSPNKACIHGAIQAVSRIKKPVKVCIIVATQLGFDGAAKGKGINSKLILELMDLITEKKCTLTEVFAIGCGDKIQKYIAYNSGDENIIAEYEYKQKEKRRFYEEWRINNVRN